MNDEHGEDFGSDQLGHDLSHDESAAYEQDQDVTGTSHIDVSSLLETIGDHNATNSGELNIHTLADVHADGSFTTNHSLDSEVRNLPEDLFVSERLDPGAVDADLSASHAEVFPPDIPTEFQEQSSDPVANIYGSIDTGMASEASQLWGLAYPGAEWPYSGTTPESPTELMEQIASDHSVPVALQETASNWLASSSVQLLTTAIPPEEATRIVTEQSSPITNINVAPVETQPSTDNPQTSDPAPVAPTSNNDELDSPGVQHDLQYWFYQHTPYTCAPSSATEIINEFTGSHYTNEDNVAHYAQQEGWLTSSGMDFNDLPALLTHFDVPAHEVSAGSDSQQALKTLENAVDDQHKSVVMFVNAPDYWYKDHGMSEGGPEGHAVRIVGIDEKNGVAVLSDTGDPNGKGSTVPLSTLMQAWSQERDDCNRSYAMVVTDVTDPAYVDAPINDSAPGPLTSTATTPGPEALPNVLTPSGVSAPATSSGDNYRPLEWIILPIAVGVGVASVHRRS
jgi:hypothetical protein